MAYAEDIGLGARGGSSSVPASWTAPAPAASPAPAPAPAGEWGMTPLDLWAVEQAQWAAAQAQTAQLQRESMAMQKAIAEMQNAYNRERLRYENEWEAWRAALQTGVQELQRQLSTGWVQQNPLLTTVGQRELLGPEGIQPTLDWQQLTGWAYGPEGQWSPTLAREQFYASLRGPRDYYAYQRAIRGDYGAAGQPAWAQALQGGASLPAFQAPSGALPGWWSQAPAGEPAAVTPPNIPPHKVNVSQWAKLLPSEQQMALGAAEEMGWDPNDWLEQMRRAAPGGTGGAKTTWWQ